MQHLNPDDVMDHLVSEGLIGGTAREHLCLPTLTPKEKNRIIVTELLSGGPSTFERFCEILKKSDQTKHIADYLEKSTHVFVLVANKIA